MSALFNQYSALWITLIGLVAIGAVLRLMRLRWRIIAPALVFAGALAVLAWAALRPSVSDVRAATDVDDILSNGKPTLVEFFSQY